ncbi:hypothetical protein LOAG_15834, partial [Loa loa]
LEADIQFVAPAQREIDAYVMNGIPVYAYSFNYFPKSAIYEEEQKKYSIFGQETLKVKRKELQIRRLNFTLKKKLLSEIAREIYPRYRKCLILITCFCI